MKESILMRQIQVALCNFGARMFRNQVGNFKLEDGRRIRVGLCKGSSDLIGFFPITITQEMVGQKIAIFVAIEVKSEKGRATPEQENFVKFVKSCGGIATICKSTEEAFAALSKNPT